MNVTNAIWRNCNAHPDRPAILFDGRMLTYRALAAQVMSTSARLSAAGIIHG
jgi:non-ribosomal peptide synthetase component E (peptide arylation enzyme)